MPRAITLSTIGALLLILVILSLSIRQTTTPYGLTLTNSVMYFGQSDRPQGSVSAPALADPVTQTDPTTPTNPAGIIGDPVSSFTYQGVLNDTNGNPAIGPLDLRFVFVGISFSVEGDELPTVLSDTVLSNIDPDSEGRFQVEVPMPPAYQVGFFIEHRLQIFDDASNTQIGDDISMSPAPIAFAAEYADRAGIADRLADTRPSTLDLQAPFNYYGLGYDIPRAMRNGNVVTLSGIVQISSTEHQMVILTTLPLDMRPHARLVFGAFSDSQNGNHARIDILPDGSVLYSGIGGGITSWFSLTGLSFTATP